MAWAESQETVIRRALLRFEALYPSALFPRTFFVVGGERAGGMSGAAGMVTGAELYRGNLGDFTTAAERVRTSLDPLASPLARPSGALQAACDVQHASDRRSP